MSEMKDIGIRLAIRREGEFVNAYLAQRSTMDGAKLLGSLAVDVAQHVVIFDAWKSLMSGVMEAAIQTLFKQKPDMREEPAPEHERSGRAWATQKLRAIRSKLRNPVGRAFSMIRSAFVKNIYKTRPLRSPTMDDLIARLEAGMTPHGSPTLASAIWSGPVRLPSPHETPLSVSPRTRQSCSPTTFSPAP